MEEQNKDSDPEVKEIIPPTPVPDKPKLSKIKVLILGACGVLVLASFAAAYFLGKNSSDEQVACTQEAKICPDGSSVGRTGPNCEFAPCPTASTTVNSANSNASDPELKGFQAEFDPLLWTLKIDDAKDCNDVECSASFGKHFILTSKKYGEKLALTISLIQSTQYKDADTADLVGKICFKPSDISTIGNDWYSARNPNYSTNLDELNKSWGRYIYMKNDLSFEGETTCVKRGSLNYYKQTPLPVKYKNTPTNIYINLRNNVSSDQINTANDIVNSIKFN